MKKVTALLVIGVVISMIAIVLAQDAKKTFNYVGVKKCKMCHKGEKKGMVFETWESKKHSKAYATLATDEAKEVAKKAGVKGDPQQAKECLVCHVTGYDAPASQKGETLTLEEGISCEACHGPGSAYKSLKIKKQIAAGTLKGADYGLIKPNEKVCVKCHNPKSPTYKEFKYAEAAKKIEHSVPKKQ